MSTDYLFGLTDNRQHRHIDIDALHLSDPAIETLKGGKLNNRLVGELLAYPDFARLLRAMEVYIDRKVLPQMANMNAVYQLAESTIKEHFDAPDSDEVITFLQEAIVDEDDYLRYRIADRFNDLMKSLFAAHKKDALPEEQASVLQEMKENIGAYVRERDDQRGKLVLLAKTLGLNINDLSDEEMQVLIKALQKSEKYKQGRKRPGR